MRSEGEGAQEAADDTFFYYYEDAAVGGDVVSLSFLDSLPAFARSPGQAGGRALNFLMPPSSAVDALGAPHSRSARTRTLVAITRRIRNVQRLG